MFCVFLCRLYTLAADKELGKPLLYVLSLPSIAASYAAFLKTGVLRADLYFIYVYDMSHPASKHCM